MLKKSGSLFRYQRDKPVLYVNGAINSFPGNSVLSQCNQITKAKQQIMVQKVLE